MSDQQAQFQINVPPDLEGGVYSNIQIVWHTAHEFTIDFASQQPARQAEDGTMVAPCRVVARIKMPPTTVFALIKALNTNMTSYEQTYGEIREPTADAGGEGGSS